MKKIGSVCLAALTVAILFSACTAPAPEAKQPAEAEASGLAHTQEFAPTPKPTPTPEPPDAAALLAEFSYGGPLPEALYPAEEERGYETALAHPEITEEIEEAFTVHGMGGRSGALSFGRMLRLLWGSVERLRGGTAGMAAACRCRACMRSAGGPARCICEPCKTGNRNEARKRAKDRFCGAAGKNAAGGVPVAGGKGSAHTHGIFYRHLSAHCL